MQEILTSLGIGNTLTQRVATSEEAETLINEGWRFVGILPNSKVILEMRRRLLSTDGIDR